MQLAAAVPAAALLARGATATPVTGFASAAKIRESMRRATAFMVERVAYRGGYVWSYLADFSRRWGELEAWPSMVWTQAPGTPEMGQVFLDALHVTGDDYYYRAAQGAASALIAGQHASGGWNYLIDFAGEESLREWYATIGRNAWRLEEFHHYYGNATFDDHATIESARFLLRLYLERRDPAYRAPVDRAIDLVLASQYPSGGWPQRYPAAAGYAKPGHRDYTGYVTLNDEVAEQNIGFLLLVLQVLHDERVREPIRRAMNCYLALQQAAPTPGWALQYTTDQAPAGARTYEPRAISPHTTAAALVKLMDFYELTGERRFLARVPEALDWLDRVEAPQSAHTADGRNHYRYIEIGTNRPIGVRRRGSNAQNGEYYLTYDMTGIAAQKQIDTSLLRRRHAALVAMSLEAVTARSPLLGRGPSLLPRLVVTRDIVGSDLNTGAATPRETDAAAVAVLLGGLDAEGCWPTELRTTSHPYRGPGPAVPPPDFVDREQVGDAWDTSPFTQATGPLGISTGTYIRNMSLLIQHLEAGR